MAVWFTDLNIRILVVVCLIGPCICAQSSKSRDRWWRKPCEFPCALQNTNVPLRHGRSPSESNVMSQLKITLHNLNVKKYKKKFGTNKGWPENMKNNTNINKYKKMVRKSKDKCVMMYTILQDFAKKIERTRNQNIKTNFQLDKKKRTEFLTETICSLKLLMCEASTEMNSGVRIERIKEDIPKNRNMDYTRMFYEDMSLLIKYKKFLKVAKQKFKVVNGVCTWK